MAYKITRSEVWIGRGVDTAGSLGDSLGRISKTGVDLEFLFARSTGDGQAVWFLAPQKNSKTIRAGRKSGLTKFERTISLRIEGVNQPGLGAKITRALGAAGINILGLSAMAIGNSVLFYVAVARLDATKATQVLKKVLESKTAPSQPSWARG